MWPLVSLFPKAQIIFGISFCDQRPGVFVDVVVRRSTLILQELTNGNETLVVSHEHCYACARFSLVSKPELTHKRERVWSLSSDFWGFRVEKLDYQSDCEERTHDIHMAYNR